MTWRELAQDKQWSKIDYLQMPLDEKIELFYHLDAVVPKIVRGDGLQKYEDYIQAHQCSDVGEYHAANLINYLRDNIEIETNNQKELTRPFHRQLELVNSIFENEGYHDGYPDWVYYSHKLQGWMPLGENLATKLRKRHNESEFGLYHDKTIDEAYIDRDKANRELRPWRYNMPTHRYTDIFCEPNTVLWLAGRLMWLIERARGYLELLSWPNLRRLNRKYYALYLVNISMEIGEITELINWKLAHEGAALEAYHRKEKASVGSAKASQNKKEQRIGAMLLEMETLIKDNPILTRKDARHMLAELAIKNAIKSDPKLWSQGKDQRDNYLSAMQTDKPFKERFGALGLQ